MLEILGPEEGPGDSASAAMEKGAGATPLGTGEPRRDADSLFKMEECCPALSCF